MHLSAMYSVKYLAVILPLIILFYAVFPQRLRRAWLLLVSYGIFYMFSGKLVVFLIAATMTIHGTGLWMADLQREGDAAIKAAERPDRKTLRAAYGKKARLVCLLGVLVCLGMLLALKYSTFFGTNVNSLLAAMHAPFTIPVPSFALPIGISFYTMQAMSYLIDVYNRRIGADRNVFRLALYLAFFPQIMEGPICRYAETAGKLWEAPAIRWENCKLGAERILFGLMKKLVVADRVNLFVKDVFAGYAEYDGFVTCMAMICYTFQLYCDFSGSMDLAIGTAQIFGITLPENFQRPFFSRTISEFWKRWHITLGTWFRDYIFYPVTMAKPMKHLTSKMRKKVGNHYGPLFAGSVALFCVWICNGLWHGAGWHYIFFGMYHFVLILIGNIIEPVVLKMKINRNALPYRIFQTVRTVILVCFGELFFRAEGLRAGMAMFRNIFTKFTFATVRDGSFFELGLDRHDYLILAIVAALLFVIGVLQEKGVQLRSRIAAKPLVFQYVFYYGLILFIIIFGAYGRGYVPLPPIYASF